MTIVPDEHALRLRAAVLALKAPAAAKRAPAPTSSVYGRAAAAAAQDVRPRTSRMSLDSRARNVETTALMSGTTLALVVLPDLGAPPPELLRTLSLLSKAKSVVVVLGVDLPRDVTAARDRPLMLPLRAGDDLANEWALLALGPRKRVAFLARRADQEWDWMLTRDPVAVHRAGTAILERVPFLGLRVPVLDQ